MDAETLEAAKNAALVKLDAYFASREEREREREKSHEHDMNGMKQAIESAAVAVTQLGITNRLSNKQQTPAQSLANMVIRAEENTARKPQRPAYVAERQLAMELLANELGIKDEMLTELSTLRAMAGFDRGPAI